MVSSSSLRNVRLGTVITAAGAGVVVVVVLLLLSNINVNNNNTLLQSKSVFAQLEEEEGVVAEAEENTTATTTTSEAATNETTTTTTAAASPARNNNMTGVKFLVIQTAQSGTLSQINATAYTLELRNVSDKTILFSDRPDRIVRSQSTSDFVGNWTMGEDSFAMDPPNAALVMDDKQGHQVVDVVELLNPVYDEQNKMLKYSFILENLTADTDLQPNFGQTTLIIDEYDPDCEPDEPVDSCY